MKAPTPFLAFAAAVLMSASAFAHSGKQETVPADGATLDSAPARIVLRFDGPMRITSLTLASGDGEVPLESEHGTDPVTEYVAEPQAEIAPGDYEVDWRGLSADGHPMEGAFGFTVGR